MTAKTRERTIAPGDPARRRLFEASVAIFAEKGFAGTTTRDIATAVGLSPASLYVHFRSKEQLLYEIALNGHTYVLAIVREALTSSSDPVEQMGTLAERTVAGHLKRHTVARIINNEVGRLSPEHQDEILALRGAAHDLIRGAIEQGCADGVFVVADVELATTAIVSLVSDACRWFRPEDEDTIRSVSRAYRTMVLRLLGHPVAATPA